jgi:hypothetical protein
LQPGLRVARIGLIGERCDVIAKRGVKHLPSSMSSSGVCSDHALHSSQEGTADAAVHGRAHQISRRPDINAAIKEHPFKLG